MRRMSTRKAALTKAKLATSIRRVHQKLHTRLFEQLENRTLFAIIPAAPRAVTIVRRARVIG